MESPTRDYLITEIMPIKISIEICSFLYRVSLTYRVKSAHKLKLTDKQLLHWMFPILAVMVVYLR